MAHFCHAEGCSVEVPPHLFTCKAHWYELPKVLRDLIWAEYKKGQEVTKRPTLRYLAVQQRAIAELAFRPNNEAAALVAMPYVLASEEFRRRAVAAGEGDPLEGVVIPTRKPAPVAQQRLPGLYVQRRPARMTADDLMRAAQRLAGPKSPEDRRREREEAACAEFNEQVREGQEVRVGLATGAVVGRAAVSPPWWRATVPVRLGAEIRTVELDGLTWARLEAPCGRS